MPATLQRKLVIKDQPTLVLATIDAARLQLPGHDEDDILGLIDEGFLAFAWNIALSHSDDSRREIRIWPDCIDWYAKAQGKGQYSRTQAQVLNTLAPARPGVRQDFVTSRRLRLLFNCGSTHIFNLIASKQLAVLPGTSWNTGPNGAAIIGLASVHRFLQSRRIACA